MMETLKQFRTHASPAGRPQPLAFLDGTLWVGCWDTSKLYAIDPKTWTTTGEVALPGMPYGIAAFEGALRVVVSIGERDDRFIYRVVPGTAVDDVARIACPEFNGSHLASDGSSLYLVQQTTRTLFELKPDGTVARSIPLPTRCAGFTFDGTRCYMIVADDEFDVLELATFDIGATGAAPATVAPMDVEARGLAFDGDTWWTSLRERNEIAAFTL